MDDLVADPLLTPVARDLGRARPSKMWLGLRAGEDPARLNAAVALLDGRGRSVRRRLGGDLRRGIAGESSPNDPAMGAFSSEWLQFAGGTSSTHWP